MKMKKHFQGFDKRIKRSVLALFMVTMFALQASAQAFPGAQKLLERRVPWLAPAVSFEQTAPDNGRECFELYTPSEGKLLIKASGENAACMAINRYLEEYCHRSMSHCGDNLSAVSPLPKVEKPLRQPVYLPIRYALNYCTLNYTMSFYQWEDWEHELDWMALHGVNVLLMPIGTEKVWQNTLKKFGYTDRQIRNFIPGPGYTAWWLMGNIEGWGGPVTQNFIDDRAKTAQKLLARMRELGISPVLQGFYGMAARCMREDHSADLLPQGLWGGRFERPDMINPMSAFFRQLADTYYAELKKCYGKDIRYFGGDPFHEGGITGSLDVADCGKAIQDMMLKHFPASTWVLQGWGGNPKQEMLKKLDKSKVLIVDLFGENEDIWNLSKGYGGTPFVWCTVTNFGEQCGLYGKLQRMSFQIDQARTGNYASLMKGVGVMPEGIGNNPVVYDMVFHAATSGEKINVESWLKSYITYRYGAFDQDVYDAWLVFLQTVYASVPEKYGLPESVFCARPGTNVTHTSSWGVRSRYYDMDYYKYGVALFLRAKNRFEGSQTYAYDMYDMLRQVTSDDGSRMYDAMIRAITDRNEGDFKRASSAFLNLILRQDSLLAQSKYFSLSRWIDQASKFGATKAERDQAVWNAKTLISYWGPDWNPETNLHEYAAKEWSGMLKTLYFPQWKMFVEEQAQRIIGRDVVPPDYFGFEKSWSEKPVDYTPPTLSRAQTDALIGRILGHSEAVWRPDGPMVR